METPRSISLRQLLEVMIEKSASDLHITCGTPPQLRVDGKLVPMNIPPLGPAATKSLCYSILTTEQQSRFEMEQELDLSISVKGLARFRVNLYFQRGSVAGAFRIISYQIPTIEELGLPNGIYELLKKPRGLVLVTGPTGCGKSTTLAAMVDRINSERHEHILTIEDPIEYLHPHKKSIINQRELGMDTKGFVTALKHVLRQDPDVVLIGEMRDLDTIQAGLNISETGHLVFATLHTGSAIQTISRIIDIFPIHQQSQIRVQLSSVLEGVITQQLIPRINGKGRVLATEILIATPAIRNLIREGKTHLLYTQMQLGSSKHYMQTMNQSIATLYSKGFLSYEDMMAHTSDQEDLKAVLGKSI